MTLYDELVARGLIAQVTDEEEIKELINNGKATFYIGFDPTQTAASRGYVLFRGANKGHTQKSYKLSPGCGHDPRSAPNLERHGSSKMQTSGWLEMPHFLNRISTCISI